MITLKDIHSKISELQLGEKEAFVQGFFKWAGDHYEEMDEEAKARVDSMMDTFHAFAKQTVKNMPDSPLKRKGLRSLEIVDKEHVSASHVLSSLESPIYKPQEMEVEAFKIFEKYLQTCLDFLKDSMDKPHQGVSMVSLGLLCACVNELFIAGHATKHRFHVQAAPHFRNVYESLNLIEVFHLHPDLLDVWSGDDWRKKWEKLRPEAVRQLLEKDKKDRDIFGFLSEFGSHPGFAFFKAQTVLEAPNSDGGTGKARVFIGGSPILNHMVIGLSHLLVSTQFLLGSIANHFQKNLLFEMYYSALKNFDNEFNAWTDKYAIPFGDAIGMPSEIKTAYLEELSALRLKVRTESEKIDAEIAPNTKGSGWSSPDLVDNLV